MFIPKKTRKKDPSIYASIYIKEKIFEQIKEIAKENDTSINNVIISMIEHCLKENK